MGKKKCYTNNVHGEDCENQARDAESQMQGRAEFARTNTLADRATAGPKPAREEVAVLEEARTKCSERSHVYDCLSFTELFAYACIVRGEDSLDDARKALQAIPNAISNERMRVICDEMFSISSRAESIKAKIRAIVEDAVKKGNIRIDSSLST